MFDQEDYYSDQEDTLMFTRKSGITSKVLAPSTGSEFNNSAGDSESLLKIMKDRGFDLNANEIKKVKEPKLKPPTESKPKPKAGFFDGGYKASLQELTKALNKSLSQADPQQASCILSYILEKKDLSVQDRSKYGIMKCNILFGLGAYEDCLLKAEQLLSKLSSKLASANIFNLMAKCKSQTNQILSGYFDYLRAKSLINCHREYIQNDSKRQDPDQGNRKNQLDDFSQSQIDVINREINHTELEYNIKMSIYKNNTNLIHPFFPEFRYRKIIQVVCGDYHTLFLVGSGLSQNRKSRQEDTQIKHMKWNNQVFGIGENTVGQITGKPKQIIYKEPILISDLSGKGISGIWATKQSSIAYDDSGNIYEWGIKQQRNDLIQVTFTVGEPIHKIEKGYKHYALITDSGKFYSWGAIEMKGVTIYNQPKPQMQDSRNIINFSCGYSHTIAVDSQGNAYALGSNQLGQLCQPTERLTKTFKKIDNSPIGSITKTFVIQDCTFFVTEQHEIFFCGRYSYQKQPIHNLRQAEFIEDFKDIISISGTVGTFYVTNQVGNLYKWNVETMVKFKSNRDNENIRQRYIASSRGSVFRVRSLIKSACCTVKRMTADPKSYQRISYEIELRDQFGLYGLPDFVIPPKCQIFLSTYKIKESDLKNENKLSMECNSCTKHSNEISLTQIIENRLIQSTLSRNQNQPWLYNLDIVIQSSGKYFFYVILDQTILLQEQLNVEVSEREKQLQNKNKNEKLLKEQERRRKAELQRQNIAQEKLRKQMEEEEKRKQTQMRAQEALKKHLRDQQEAKQKQQEERKARKQLQTGGGFDLNKLKKKSSSEFVDREQKAEKLMERVERFDKTGDSFLPDINQRPSSKRKVNLPKPSELISLKDKTILKSSVGDFSSTGFTSSKPTTPHLKEDLTKTNSITFKRGGTPGNNLVRRGVSKRKN